MLRPRAGIERASVMRFTPKSNASSRRMTMAERCANTTRPESETCLGGPALMQHDIPINGVAPESRFDLYAELKRLCATWSAVSGDETASVDDRSHAFAAVALLAADEVLTR